MKKVLLFLLAFLALRVAGREIAENDYSISRDDSKFESFESVQSRIDALQVDDDKLKQIGTSELLNICLDFPYNIDMFLYDSPEKGFSAICKNFNGYRELLTRVDLTDALIAECKEIPLRIEGILAEDEVEQGAFSFRCYILFYMLGLDDVACGMTDDMRVKKDASLKSSIECMSEHLDIFGISYDLACKLMSSSKKISESGNYSVTSRTTPNGYSVEVGEFVQIDFTSSEKADLKSRVQNEYHAEVLDEATRKYNCHAYAWHMSKGHSEDMVWMNNPDIYWNSGCYYEVPESEAEVVYYVGTHSAIRKSSYEYVSKMGPVAFG
ncbi:MAG: hypothetical protein NC127_04925 [Muribaculum sp.]|nr:hypothetical protein [Muribaculum sp.]